MTTRPTQMPSRQTLKRLPGRVVYFLQAIGTGPELRAIMAQGGYGREDHAEGARLLAAVFAYDSTPNSGNHADALAKEASLEIERWVQKHFGRYQSALRRLHPSELRLFEGIEAPEPRQAVLALATLLNRLNQLERAAKKERTRKRAPDPRSALKTLSRRGLDPGERERLKQRLAAAQAAPEPEEGTWRRDERASELLALYRWYSDWAATAKSLIGRKRFLMALGLASRGRSGTEPGEEG